MYKQSFSLCVGNSASREADSMAIECEECNVSGDSYQDTQPRYQLSRIILHTTNHLDTEI